MAPMVLTPATEGIKYAGSKRKLIPWILHLAKKTDAVSVLDGFAGATHVSQAFARAGYRVVCNDIAVWSEILGTCYLLCEMRSHEYQELVDHLNSLAPKDGWFTEHYGGDPAKEKTDGLKKPWQIHNTRKLDAIREEIDRLSLGRVDRAVALTSLMLALDRVDSTLGHFVSYLKDWSPRSYKPLKLEVPLLIDSEQSHQVSRGCIFDLAATLPMDLAYYDPPYGSNNEKMPPSRVRYASYYHLWTSVCLFDRPRLVGKARRRADSSDTVAATVFEEFRKNAAGEYIAVDAIGRLLAQSRARWIILSYSSGGRATARELHDVIQTHGELVETIEVDHKKHVMAAMKWTNEWLRDAETPNREFLFLIKNKRG